MENKYDIEDLRGRILDLKHEFNQKQIDREELSNILILSLFSQKHIFLLGEPGVSKTGSLEIFLTTVKTDKKFQITIKNDTKYEEIFGDTYRDENGKLKHDPSYSIVDAHTAILDECYKGNSKVVNSLLSIMSPYRTVDMLGIGPVKAPILIVTGAANELPIDKELDAQRDRFVFSYKVEKITGEQDWIKFASRNYDRNPELQTKFEVDEIKYITELAKEHVRIPESFFKHLYAIRQQVELFKIGVSERKFDNALDVFLVSALLNGRDTVDFSEFFILEHILWKEIIDIQKIKEILSVVIFGATDTVVQYIENIELERKRLKSIVNGSLNDFLRYRKTFSSAESAEFERFKNYVNEVIDGYTNLLSQVGSVVDHYEMNMLIESQIKENHFVMNMKSPIYQHVNIEDVYAIRNDVAMMAEELSEWLESYGEMYAYNMMVNVG
jgi:MoxR-like ATPase